MLHLVDYQHVKRVAYRQVALDGRVKGHERALERVLERGVECDDAVQDGLSVFGLAYLEVRGVNSRADEVALGVDIKEPCVIALDVASYQDGAAEGDVLGELAGVTRDDLPDGVTDQLSGLEHGRDVVQILLCALGNAFLQLGNHALCCGQVACRLENYGSLMAYGEAVKLAEN